MNKEFEKYFNEQPDELNKMYHHTALKALCEAAFLAGAEAQRRRDGATVGKNITPSYSACRHERLVSRKQ